MSTALLPLLLIDGIVARLEAVGLVVLGLGYTASMVREARRSAVRAAFRDAAATSAAADAAGAPGQLSSLRSAVTALAGFGLLLLGGSEFVTGAVSLAQTLGMSERLIGLTIVAIGTSLPELVTSAIAAYRGHSELAVGNVVGSNIFNVFLCLGTASLAGSVVAPLRSVAFDLAWLALMTCLAALLLRTQRTISRREGALVLGAYLTFVSLAIASA